MTNLTSIHAEIDVTEEIIDMALSIHDGWYERGRIDWQDFWDRLDGSELEDGSQLDLGNDLNSPALLAIKKAVRQHRATG